MEAIIELIAAIATATVQALVVAVFLALELVLWLVYGMTCLILGITRRDKQAAKDRFQQRRSALKSRRQKTPAHRSQQSKPQPTAAGTLGGVIVLVLIIAVPLGYFAYQRHVRKQNEAATRPVMASLMQQFVAHTESDAQPPLTPGTLPQTDAWSQPLELFVDPFPAFTLLVIRSAGHDGETGTLDDLLEIGVAKVDHAAIAKFLLATGRQAIAEKWGLASEDV
ncbi:MAG: hypothetical protein AAGI68_11450, partial [Planctomycetota bacterium]